MGSPVAQETLEIVGKGRYEAPSGKVVDIGAAVEAAVHGTRLYTPHALDRLPRAPRSGPAPRVEVTDETTAAASRRLVLREGVAHVVALNFASARRPGGGFLGGAKAQEEDLARCSALYTCQLPQRAYYDANRAERSAIYTDHIIYSPDVPFFRDDSLALLEKPFLLSIITAPAPNAGAAATQGEDVSRVRTALEARARKVLDVAVAHEHRCLVLGAWGCGVFQNNPHHVAETFAGLLEHPELRGAFDRVVFAVYDKAKDRPRYRVFADRFATGVRTG